MDLMLTCERCGGPVSLPPRGRTPEYCSTKCRVAAHRARQLPPEMTKRPRWARFANTPRAGGKPTRRPVMANGRSASSTNPRTWTTYAAVKVSKAGHGVGFMLGDGIGAIDLDRCIVAGRLEKWAQEIVDACPATYIEISPSGTGLHIFGHMSPRPGRGQRGGARIEIYSRDRFMTVTGDRWPGSVNTLADLNAVVASL